MDISRENKFSSYFVAKTMNLDAHTLQDWIDIHFGGVQKKFAEAQGVAPAQVTQWLKNNFIVVDNKLYSSRRELVK